MDLFLERNKFQVLDMNDKIFTVTISFLKTQYKKFFEYITGVKVVSFDEKPYTLQDYFMSFYKEEKEFGGLSGVVGNKK